MILFITQNWVNILAVLVLLLLVVGAFIWQRKMKKQGKGCCNCSNCPSAGKCGHQ